MELKEGKWCREGTVDQINRTEIDPVREKKKKKWQLDGGGWEIFLLVRQIRVEWEYSKNRGGGGDGGRYMALIVLRGHFGIDFFFFFIPTEEMGPSIC